MQRATGARNVCQSHQHTLLGHSHPRHIEAHTGS